jgi:hypothetical protein
MVPERVSNKVNIARYEMKQLEWKHALSRDQHRLLLSGNPVAMHCHHYNINLQKTIEETSGEEGIRLLFLAAEEASFQHLKDLTQRHSGVKTIKSKLEMTTVIYQNSGLGVIHFHEIGPEGGKITSRASHHVTGWLAKHGRRRTPGCHFARGWIAGALEALFQYPLGYYRVEELQCKMVQDCECTFMVTTTEA